jgi:hypothetical protein
MAAARGSRARGQKTPLQTVRLKEEVVIRTERTERVQTVRDTLRRDEIEAQHASKRSAR